MRHWRRHLLVSLAVLLNVAIAWFAILEPLARRLAAHVF